MKRTKPFMIIVSLLTVILIGGCAMTVVSRTMPLKPADSGGPGWFISAKSEGTPFTDVIIFYINNKEVFRGSMSLTEPRKIFSWYYEGQKIEAEVSFNEGGGSMVLGHDCIIYMNGKEVTTLRF